MNNEHRLGLKDALAGLKPKQRTTRYMVGFRQGEAIGHKLKLSKVCQYP